jgi:hypothetical protein
MMPALLEDDREPAPLRTPALDAPLSIVFEVATIAASAHLAATMSNVSDRIGLLM